MSIEALIKEIDYRFGYKTLRRASELLHTKETLSTEIMELDKLLAGGLLVGGSHNINGRPTCGASSLLYRIVAGVQNQSVPVIYLDMAKLFDAANAADMGVSVNWLLYITPQSIKHTLFLIQTVASQRLPCLIVIDSPSTFSLTQIKPILRKAPVTLLILSEQFLPQIQVTLYCERRKWLMNQDDVIGFNSEISLCHHPFLPEQSVTLDFKVPKEDENAE